MPSQNLNTFRASHQAFNNRDFDALLKNVREDVTYHDHARDHTFKGHAGFREFLEGWASAFSDAEVTKPKYIDAGNVVIAEFIGRGTNDGPLGPLPETGKRMNLPFCEVVRFDEQGRIAECGIYYDQVSLMTQLGHTELPMKAAVG